MGVEGLPASQHQKHPTQELCRRNHEVCSCNVVLAQRFTLPILQVKKKSSTFRAASRLWCPKSTNNIMSAEFQKILIHDQKERELGLLRGAEAGR